ncbi:MAG TPA: low specificity L-threonine aldolase [Bacillota bacterium]|nr:low specificity L-threonine aldolase [Bacillota bacterium]
MEKFIDLRSDTITLQTDEMRMAMLNAEVGDDVYGEDVTVKRLEKMGAEMLGKEAALFVASGTMGNQLAIMTHTKRGDEVIACSGSHIVLAEVGAAAVLSGVTVRTVDGENDIMEPEDVRALIRGKNQHFPDTGLICLENATSLGTVYPLPVMAAIRDVAREHNIPVHLDGARIFNAAAALGVDAREIASHVDSVQMCLSKGLCAPVGSLLVGSAEFIEAAHRNRKMLGGGLRQAGYLAAAGIIALEKMTGRLKEDHDNLKLLAKGLSEIRGISVNMRQTEINMVFADIAGTGLAQQYIIDRLLEKGIKANDGREGNYIRFVTNHGVSSEDVEYVLNCMREIVGN